jgi:8-oxo-dGTP diphosphatase
MKTLLEAEIRDQARKDGISHISTGVAVLRDGKLLIVRRSRVDSFAGKYELPGGGVDPGETITQGAVREVQEETGLTVTNVLVIFKGFDYSTSTKPHVRQVNFVVEVEPGPVVLNPKEHDAFMWVSENNYQNFTMSLNMKQCIDAALRAIDSVRA